MDNIDTTIKERFKELPKKLQDFILAPDFGEKIKSISASQPLDQVQSEAFENEIMLVLLRIEDINSFTANVHHNVQITRERAEKLSRATMQKIFMPVTEMLKIQGVPSQNVSEDNFVQNKDIDEKKQEKSGSSSGIPQHSKPKDIDIFHKKLTQQVHIPKEEERINLEEKEVQEKPKQDTPLTDPYREPID